MLWNKENLVNALKNYIKLTIGSNFSAFKFSIDSRTINFGEIFIAINGNKFDGHNFIELAVKNGAVAIIVSKNQDYNVDVPIIVVDDTILAMQKLAQCVINNSTAKVIAITGSNGKTTTKNLLYDLLQSYGKVSCTIGNFNNHIGLPLSILNAEIDADFLVLEMGMNHKHEIYELCQIAMPDIALITNIGSNHIGNFKSKDEIAMAKAEIFSNSCSTAVINTDDEESNLLLNYAKKNGNKIVTFGENSEADIQLIKYENSRVYVKVFDYLYNYYFPNYGIHFIKNSLGVVSVLYVLNLNLDENLLTQVFESFYPGVGRGKQYKIKLYNKNILLIDDSYNASYESVLALLNYIQTFKFKKILILGDILEIGIRSYEIYLKLSKEVQNIDVIITVGNGIECLNRLLSNVLFHYNSVDDLIKNFEKVINNIPDDNIIIGVKGSNKIGLNKIFRYLNI
jgi:UDP-N-acetylmuramoyl-tripeptide--D-alanyl-D-alanine ligase